MTAPRLLLVAFVVTLLVVVTAGVVGVAGERAGPQVGGRVDGEEQASDRTEALAVLGAWDRRRARAWADGDAAALAGLYVPNSTAGERDVAMLRTWRGRGLRATGLRMQLLAVEVLDAADARLVLRVTDRVAGVRAVGRGTDVALPADRPTTRLVRLVRRAGTWLVAEVV